MSLYRLSSRFAKTVCRYPNLLDRQRGDQFLVHCNQIHSLIDSQNKVVTGHVLLQDSTINTSLLQRLGFSSYESPEPSEKKNEQSLSGVTNQNQDSRPTLESQSKVSLSDSRRISLESFAKDLLDVAYKLRSASSAVKTSLLEIDTSKDASRALPLLKTLLEDFEMAENQLAKSLSKSLLDVADNQQSVSSDVKDSFTKVDTSDDGSGAVPLLKKLLKDAQMIEKQLVQAGSMAQKNHEVQLIIEKIELALQRSRGFRGADFSPTFLFLNTSMLLFIAFTR